MMQRATFTTLDPAHRGGSLEVLDRHYFAAERLDDVAGLDVVVVGQPDAALIAGLDLAGVVLEAPEGRHLSRVNDHVVPKQAHLGAARDLAVRHVGAGDRADLGHLEDLPHFGAPQIDLFGFGLQKPEHGVLDLVGDVVDHRVNPDVDFLLLRQVLGTALGPHVVADDDGVARRGEMDVGLRDRSGSGVNDPDLYLVGGLFVEALGKGLDRTLDIGLDDQ